MKQEGNHLLMDVAAIAIVVAAVGALYARSNAAPSASTSTASSSGRVALAGYRPEGAASADAVRQRVRNYQSEVTAALARTNENPTAPALDGDVAEEDDLFDIDPLSDSEPYPLASEGVVPANPAAPTDGNLTAVSTDGPVAQDSPSEATGGQMANGEQTPVQANAGDYDYAQTGTMSDTDVYRLVVNNLDGEQRDGFVRAYAAMSAEQRADLLNGFRQQIQGDQAVP